MMNDLDQDTELGVHRPLDPGQWKEARRWWWQVREAFGGWHEVPPKMLPAFYAHPDSFQRAKPEHGHERRSYATSLPEACAIQEAARKMSSLEAEPVWFAIPRLLPGEKLGSLHQERKRCGKDGCKCQSGREEDLHGPYWHHRWRDEDGNQKKEYVPKEKVEETREAIERRQSRVEQMRTLRRQYMEQARASRYGTDGIDVVGFVERWTRDHEEAIRQSVSGFDFH
ncbi:hypothetical protein BSZ35_19020 [Salinibacter sp. 10B]|uniref:DUF6788 family protein n=1 Tax=Salinibacter sp. 10B TaxID=1923971 RepID=UPI000CF49D92|nr:DUF6788 family protein [Salinibacter sp. 10B]PQJ26742.1 hypothetical protein BSZ35_19020 [Salinibacter sp. 10B]